MAAGDRLFLSNQANKYSATALSDPQCYGMRYSGGTSGNITSSPTLVPTIFAAPFTGRISNVVISVGQNGVDATNPLSITVDVTVNGTSIFGTKPIIAKAAGTGEKTTCAAGTGITQSVITAGAVTCGDVVKIAATLTRTASPSTEIADFAFFITFQEAQNFDPYSTT